MASEDMATSNSQTAEAPWVSVEEFTFPAGWSYPERAAECAHHYCDLLEQGHILFFGRIPYDFPAEDREFLVHQEWSEARLHKNISYRPTEDVLKGASGGARTEARVHTILRRFSSSILGFLAEFLSPYAGKWELDYASFRPLEEQGRDLPLHKRGDLLHVDAFPSRPTRGARILRVFTNLNPSRVRVWETTDGFPVLAERYARTAGLDDFSRQESFLARTMRALSHSVGATHGPRTPYDSFMLHFHDYLKENAEFQAKCPKIRLEFPPLATWLVLTDGVPHSVISGQYAIEQTLLIPPNALVSPEYAPYRVLEQMAGRPLIS